MLGLDMELTKDDKKQEDKKETSVTNTDTTTDDKVILSLHTELTTEDK